MLADQLTNHLYMSKISTFQSCPMKYYWQHHLWLQAKDKPIYFTFGSALHKAVELSLIHGPHIGEAFLSQRFDLLETLLGDTALVEGLKPKLNGLTEQDLSNLLTMQDAFFEKWNSLGIKRVISTEASVMMQLNEKTGVWEKDPIPSQLQSTVNMVQAMNLFTDWVVKADFIFEDANGSLWVGDLKTTSGYGAATAKYYHSSPQTKTYFYILQKHMPKLQGTKIFVVTKQKIRCEVETIVLTEADKWQAELFIEESVTALTVSEALQYYPRFMTSCINSLGQECPYIPLCINQHKSEAYVNDLIANWYKVSSPDEHLELKEA